jgi:hypothetical protein
MTGIALIQPDDRDAVQLRLPSFGDGEIQRGIAASA